MLFTRYNLLLFKSNGEKFIGLHVRGWLLPALVLCFMLLVAGNVLLWRHFQPYAGIRRQAMANEELAYRQYAEVYGTVFDILALEDDYRRISDLGSKLSVMLNIDHMSALPEAGIGASTLRYSGGQGAGSLLRLAHDTFDNLYASMRQEEVLQQRLMKELVLQKENLTRIPSIWPTRGRFTSSFGYRRNPVTHRTSFHKGIDISASTGTPIRAPAAGTVVFAKWFSTYGRTVEIDHGNGLKTRFAHMHRIKAEVGDTVKRGDVVGFVGNTGRSIASHLHYEVYKNGRPVNPLYYIMSE